MIEFMVSCDSGGGLEVATLYRYGSEISHGIIWWWMSAC